jgi:THO complex subunit 2
MCVFQVREEEKNQRQDLFILATSYSGQLKAKSASMIRENDFHQVSDKVILFVLSKPLTYTSIGLL